MDSTNHFISTQRAARIAGCEAHVLRTQHARHGHWRGLKPRKLPNGRLLWPRAEVYASIGLIAEGKHVIDARALLAFAECRGLDQLDPAVHALMFALLAPEDDERRDVAHTVDDAVAIAQIVEAFASRLTGALRRMSPLQRSHSFL